MKEADRDNNNIISLYVGSKHYHIQTKPIRKKKGNNKFIDTKNRLVVVRARVGEMGEGGQKIHTYTLSEVHL